MFHVECPFCDQIVHADSVAAGFALVGIHLADAIATDSELAGDPREDHSEWARMIEKRQATDLAVRFLPVPS